MSEFTRRPRWDGAGADRTEPHQCDRAAILLIRTSFFERRQPARPAPDCPRIPGLYRHSRIQSMIVKTTHRQPYRETGQRDQRVAQHASQASRGPFAEICLVWCIVRHDGKPHRTWSSRTGGNDDHADDHHSRTKFMGCPCHLAPNFRGRYREVDRRLQPAVRRRKAGRPVVRRCEAGVGHVHLSHRR